MVSLKCDNCVNTKTRIHKREYINVKYMLQLMCKQVQNVKARLLKRIKASLISENTSANQGTS